MVLYMCNMHMTEQSNNYGWQLSEQHTSWVHTTCSKYKAASVLVFPYVHKNLPDWSLFCKLYKEAPEHNKTVGDFENEFTVVFKPPTPGAPIMRVHVMLCFSRWLHWICRLITMVFFLFCFVSVVAYFILRFTWKQLITFNNKPKWR